MKRLFFKNRPSAIAPQKPLPSLKVCLLLDLVGCAFIVIPFFGEFIDIIWAPISAFIFFRMFGGGVRGLFGGAFSFIEELIPGLNFIPTFTIAWFLQYAKRNKTTPITSITTVKPVRTLFGYYAK